LPKATWTYEGWEVSTRRRRRGKKRAYLGGMKLVLPFDREIVRVLDDPSHQFLRVNNPVLIRHHPPRNRQHRPSQSNVEQHRPSLRNLEVEERIGIDEREKDENGGEGTGEEGDETGEEGGFRFGELVDVAVGQRVGEAQSLLVEVGEFIKFTELPTCERSKASGTDGRGVLMILLYVRGMKGQLRRDKRRK
jgi:hypothetical protein